MNIEVNKSLYGHRFFQCIYCNFTWTAIARPTKLSDCFLLHSPRNKGSQLIFICHVDYDLNSKLQKWYNGIKLSGCTTILSLILFKTGI